MKRALLFLLLFAPFATALTPIEAGTMEARVLIVNEVEFLPTGDFYFVNDASGELSWFPREDALQQVTSLTYTPTATVEEDFLLFSWEQPGRSEEFEVTATITTENRIVPVREKVPFPIKNVPPEIAVYLDEEEIIDQSHSIQQLAQELAGDSDDLYEVVYNLADWTTTNVEYSLASLSEPAIQKSSQVLASKWGKCDELTALFISLNRALGIPARFVAGYSYTNSELLPEEWGGHGWSEVWFPDVGWVPFDVTYGEYGYLDAGHVKLKISEDAKENSVDYSASGRDFQLQTESLDIFVTPLDLRRLSSDRVEMTMEAPYTNVGFGSVVLILATLKNTEDHYVATRLDLAQTTSTEMLSDTYTNVLLHPYEEKTLPFLVKIDDALDAGFRYEFPFKLVSRLGNEETIMIDVHPSSPTYAEEDYDAMIDVLANSDSDEPAFTVTCERGTPVLVGKTSSHRCVVGGAVGEIVTVCGESCEDLPVQDGAFTLELSAVQEGVQTTKFDATSLGNSVSFLVTSEVVAESTFSVVVDAPSSAKMDDELLIEIRLDSYGAEPTYADVRTVVAYADAEQRVEEFPTTVQLQLPGDALAPGENTVTVEISWEDELGMTGSTSSTATITLTDASFAHKTRFFLLDIGDWFGSLFS